MSKAVETLEYGLNDALKVSGGSQTITVLLPDQETLEFAQAYLKGKHNVGCLKLTVSDENLYRSVTE